MWEVADFQLEQVDRPWVVSWQEAGSFHSGHQEEQNQKREYQPLSRDICSSPWLPTPAAESSTTDQR